ncbi:hypothetical protein BC827DRAFT_600301 [Russula dissimulans]|nr:hypothetical protein BC827DRAFT_600301 [Russula dissimulans]
MPPRPSRGTAWTSHGSLPSDRIRPPGASHPAKSEKGKGKAKAADPPRSAAVRRLDELLAGLLSSESTGTQPPNNEHKKTRRKAVTDAESGEGEGCFCQARVHALSEYTPLCTTCGLVLCTLHPPHRACPHCTTPLLARPARAALIAQLEELREQTLAEEAAARGREAEELRLAEGAFPALGGGGGNVSAGSGGGGHRVLSVDARTGRVKVDSYSSFSRETVLSAADADGEAAVDGAGVGGHGLLSRVPPPPREVEYVRVQRGEAMRWVDLKGGGGTAKYVAPLPAPGSEYASGGGKAKAKASGGSRAAA